MTADSPSQVPVSPVDARSPASALTAPVTAALAVALLRCAPAHAATPASPPAWAWLAGAALALGAGWLLWHAGRAHERRLSAARRQSVLDSLEDAVVITGSNGLIRHSNRAAARLIGAERSQIEGTPLTQVLTGRTDARVARVRTRAGESIPVALRTGRLAGEAGDVLVMRNLRRARRDGRRLRYLASHDALTRLPNRARFQTLLAQALAARRDLPGSAPRLAVVYADLDDFREVNDTLGHSLGDQVIKELTGRLAHVLPAGAVLGRLAGDELGAFLAVEAGGREALGDLARAALEEIGRVMVIGGHEVFLTASIGIALFPGDGASDADLIRNADAAMLWAKQEGGNTYAFYASHMNAEADERVMLKGKLRLAVERHELVIRYQPKVDLRDGRIVGAEALLRWRLPGVGEIPPSRFIPLAEESNLIQDIGFWVLDQVCHDYQQMRAPPPGSLRGADPGRISINLSLRQLRQASFIVQAASVFQKHQVPPAAFELEITETTLMSDGPRTVALLQQLASMGLHLSIDDFGTGYSSLAALRQFPIDTLKIDQSFVRHVGRDEADAAIVRTIIAMGRSLGFDVIAEGLESRTQLAFLRDNGCHLAQGRLFGEPLTAEELLGLLARQAGGTLPYASLLHAPHPARVS